MKSIIKSATAIILCIILAFGFTGIGNICIGLSCLSVFADDSSNSGTCGYGLTWKLSSGTLTISGSGAMKNYTSVWSEKPSPWYDEKDSIKSVVIGENVCNIGSYAFEYCSNLATVSIPSSVTMIGEHAFSECENLSNVVIPDSVSIIGEYAFYGCESLKGISFGTNSSLTQINDGVFYNCKSLKSINIPQNISTIENGAFIGCQSLTSIIVDENNSIYDSRNNCNAVVKTATNTIVAGCKNTVIPSTVTGIGDNAFSGCSGLETVKIPDNITSIGKAAFSNCEDLSSVTIPSSIKKIEDYAFYYCSNLQNVNIQNGVTEIGSEVFYHCDNLQKIALPDSVEKIENCAFQCCEGLTSITIPSSVQSIGEGAFSGCDELSKCYYKGTIAQWNSIEFEGGGANPCYSYSKDCDLYFNNKLLTVITAEDLSGATCIGNYAFCNCKSLTSVTIPESVKEIGSSAFDGCKNLTSVTIPDSVESIERGAFWNCTSLSGVVIPSNVTCINGYTFYGCTGLTEIIIPKNVTIVEDGAFAYCSNLSNVTLLNEGTAIEGNAFYGTEFYNKDSNWENGVLYLGDTLLKASDTLKGIYTIKSGTKYISEEAFSGCESLTGIVIPDSVVSIGMEAFSSCSKLASINIPEGITTIEYGTFYDCTGLTSIVIPDSVTSVGGDAFSGCSSIGSIDLPDGITSIEEGTFYNCTALETISIPESVTIIDYCAFGECEKLKSITIPKNVEEIGWNVFRGCSSLDSIIVDSENTIFDSRDNCNAIIKTESDALIIGCTNSSIPKDIKIIDEYAFAYCDGIENVTIPDSVTTICTFAFLECENLSSITISKGTSTIDGFAFFDCENLNDVYYLGTESYKNGNLLIGNFNYELTNATWHYSDEETDDRPDSEQMVSISVKSNPNKTSYSIGETFNAKGLVLIATFADGSQKEITSGFVCSGFDSLSAGEKTITVTYNGISTNVTASVTGSGSNSGTSSGTESGSGSASETKKAASISVKTLPDKTNYKVGENFDKTGLTLTVNYSDGTTSIVSSGYTCTGFNSVLSGTKTITVTYDGCETTFSVTVSRNSSSSMKSFWDKVYETIIFVLDELTRMLNESM